MHRVVGVERLQREGSAVLVHAAAGGVGSLIVRFARLAGVDPSRIFGAPSFVLPTGRMSRLRR